MLPNLIPRIPFSSMQSLCPSILLFLAAAFFPIGTSRAEIRIRPPGQGANHSVYVLATGSRLELECELERGDYSGPEDVDSLDWMRGRLRIAHNWLSMYTQPKVDEQGRWIRQTLVIPKMEQQTAGDYSCLFYDDKKRTVHLHVLERLNWRTPTEKPGGPLGQPLTIDCGAEGVPDEAVKILDHKGRAIEESTQGEVLVAGADATIQRLGREHQGMKIRCVAVRRIILDSPNSSAAPYDSLHTDERELTVDVWLPPKFDDREPGPRYAVPGSRQVLTWTVLESNPPVSAWNLRKDGRAIRIAPNEGEAKPGVKKPRMEFVQNMDAAQPLFAVVFNDVQSEDFGRYTLVVHNGKLESEKTLTMVLIEPPSQPRVSVEWVSSNGSVNWRVEEQQGKGQLPTTYYLITYKPLKRVPLPQQNVSTTNGMQGRPSEPQLLPLPPIDPNVSNSAPYYVRRRKNPRNLYEMAGLDPYTEYEFTFTAGNFEAGEGDPIQVKLITVDWQRPDGPGVDQTSSAASRIEAGFPFGSRMLAMFVAMLLPMARQFFGAALPQQQFTL